MQNFIVMEDRTNSFLVACILICVLHSHSHFADLIGNIFNQVHLSICRLVSESVGTMNFGPLLQYKVKVIGQCETSKHVLFSIFCTFVSDCITLKQTRLKDQSHFNVRIKLKTVSSRSIITKIYLRQISMLLWCNVFCGFLFMVYLRKTDVLSLQNVFHYALKLILQAKIHVTFSCAKSLLWSGRILWRARIRAT